jgi:hypothetical protein
MSAHLVHHRTNGVRTDAVSICFACPKAGNVVRPCSTTRRVPLAPAATIDASVTAFTGGVLGLKLVTISWKPDRSVAGAMVCSRTCERIIRSYRRRARWLRVTSAHSLSRSLLTSIFSIMKPYSDADGSTQ